VAERMTEEVYAKMIDKAIRSGNNRLRSFAKEPSGVHGYFSPGEFTVFEELSEFVNKETRSTLVDYVICDSKYPQRRTLYKMLLEWLR
jgi:hypothetical protein